MGFKCEDGLIDWKDNDRSFLPKEIDDDELSFLLKALIAKVKEEHALYQYKRDLKNYSADIKYIMQTAIKNGYNITEAKEIVEKKAKNDDSNSINYDNIVDG
jgi:uncharacterized protein (UPF0335 family)